MSTTTALAQIRGVLGAKREWGSPPSGKDAQRLLRGHTEYLRRRQNAELRMLREAYLEPLRVQKAKLRGHEGSDPGKRVLDALGRRYQAPTHGPSDGQFADACSSVAIPSWQVDTPLTTTPSNTGLSTFARSTRSQGTLEIAAACGKYPTRAFPGSQLADAPGANVCAGFGEYNETITTLGTTFYLPDHDVATLSVSVQLVVDELLASGWFTFPGQYVFTMSGDRNVGVNGGAAAWVDALMTLYTSSARVTVAQKVLAQWTAYEDTTGNTEAPTGPFVTLSKTVAVQPTTTMIFLAVDLHAVAWAQGFRADAGQAFAQVELREKSVTPIDMALGYPLSPAKVRVRSVAATICPGDVL